MTYDLEFTSSTEADAYLSALSFSRLPAKALYTHSAHGFDDDGRKIVTFGRQCFSQAGEPARWQFAEQVVR
jgi:hypothetical protein